MTIDLDITDPFEQEWMWHIRESADAEKRYQFLWFKEYLGRITTKSQWIRDHGRCRYCGDVGQSIDHVLPKSRGGERTMANGVLACFRCNSFKGARTPEEAGMTLLEPGMFKSPEEAAAYRHVFMSTRKRPPLTQRICIIDPEAEATRGLR